MRLFVAIELADALKRSILKLISAQRSATRDLRWVSENQLHITLKFLGEVEEPRIPAVKAIVTEVSAATAAFSCTVRGLGGFPGPRSPRVLWAGVDDPASACRRWVELADPRFTDLGVEPERRPFTPHLTLARSNGPAGSRTLAALLERAPAVGPMSIAVSEFVLFRSELRPGGSVYTALLRAPVGGGGGSGI